jgi:hypothetical protein
MSRNARPAGVSLDARLGQADAALARFRNETLGHFIDGKAVVGVGELSRTPSRRAPATSPWSKAMTVARRCAS